MDHFEEAHDAFIKAHLRKRKGERKGRLARGHREAEKLFCRNVWWPVQGDFSGLHPEFEVLDWRGLSYYCDFAYMTPALKLIFEIKGFGPHVRDMDRQKYCNELNRETFLAAMGYQVVSFAYDDVAQRPELCITLLRLLLGRFLADSAVPDRLEHVAEREILRLACLLARPVRPCDVTARLSLNHRTAVRHLESLCRKGMLTPMTGRGGKHVVKYAMIPGAMLRL